MSHKLPIMDTKSNRSIIDTVSDQTPGGSSQESQLKSLVSKKPDTTCHFFQRLTSRTVLLQAMKQEPPMDAKCRDKFLVQSVAVTADKEFSNIAAIVGSTVALPLN